MPQLPSHNVSQNAGVRSKAFCFARMGDLEGSRIHHVQKDRQRCHRDRIKQTDPTVNPTSSSILQRRMLLSLDCRQIPRDLLGKVSHLRHFTRTTHWQNLALSDTLLMLPYHWSEGLRSCHSFAHESCTRCAMMRIELDKIKNDRVRVS